MAFDATFQNMERLAFMVIKFVVLTVVVIRMSSLHIADSATLFLTACNLSDELRNVRPGEVR